MKLSSVFEPCLIAMNRNKYGVAVDIRTPSGKQVLWRLIETADVLVENFRPGTMTRLGFGYEEVHQLPTRYSRRQMAGLRLEQQISVTGSTLLGRWIVVICCTIQALLPTLTVWHI